MPPVRPHGTSCCSTCTAYSNLRESSGPIPTSSISKACTGLEQVKWSPVEVDQVTYDVTVPFIRMMAGPMDYTQGRHAQCFESEFPAGEFRAYESGNPLPQLAEYVVFDAPLAMLCDSPSAYGREPECLRFISGVPTVWDETEVLAGEVGDHIVTARRHGDVWYVGGLAGWDGRTVRVDLSLLPEGTYAVELFRDGENAARIAQDYVREEFLLAPGKSFDVKMFPGGGFAARITRR